MTTKLAATDTVRIVNTGKAGAPPFIGKWNSQTWEVPPGGEAFVPFPAACLWFGHPDAKDEGPERRRKYRTLEYERLRFKYGAHDDREAKISADEMWKRNIPTIQVYTLDGTRLITVMEDPTGDHLNLAATTVQAQRQHDKVIATLQEQVETLSRQLEALNAGAGQVAAEDDTPTVKPATVPTVAATARQSTPAAPVKRSSGTTRSAPSAGQDDGVVRRPAGDEAPEDTPTRPGAG